MFNYALGYAYISPRTVMQKEKFYTTRSLRDRATRLGLIKSCQSYEAQIISREYKSEPVQYKPVSVSSPNCPRHVGHAVVHIGPGYIPSNV